MELLTFMGFNDLAGNGKPKTCAFRFKGFKRGKNLWQLFRRNPTSVVFYRNEKLAGGATGMERYFSIWESNGFCSISQEIQKSLFHFRLINWYFREIWSNVQL